MGRVKEFREQYGLTQQEVANYIGMPKRTLENWEEGKNTPPEWVENLVLERLCWEVYRVNKGQFRK